MVEQEKSFKCNRKRKDEFIKIIIDRKIGNEKERKTENSIQWANIGRGQWVGYGSWAMEEEV